MEAKQKSFLISLTAITLTSFNLMVIVAQSFSKLVKINGPNLLDCIVSPDDGRIASF
jgi:hypothetical protein